MRIGLVLPAVPGYSETFFRNKIHGLETKGHEVILIVPYKANGNKENYSIVYGPNLDGGKISKLLNSLFALFGLCIRSFKNLNRFWKLESNSGSNTQLIFKKAILNSHILNLQLNWVHFGYATTAIDREMVAKAIGAKMAVSFRGFDIGIYPIQHPGCYQRLWEHVNLVHSISNDLLEKAYQLGLPKEIPVVKITPAIEVEQFISGGREYFRGSEIKFLTVGRLHWKKGLEYVLEALSILKKRGFKIEYTIAGNGAELDRLIYAAYQFDLRNEVKFIGVIASEAVATLIASNDIYIQYSVQEGFCNAVLEAQAAGMLCVVSDAEGLPENVLHEITGWVVPKRQPELLAAQLEKIIKLPETILKSTSERAVERVIDEFNLEKQQEAFEAFYQYKI